MNMCDSHWQAGVIAETWLYRPRLPPTGAWRTPPTVIEQCPAVFSNTL